MREREKYKNARNKLKISSFCINLPTKKEFYEFDLLKSVNKEISKSLSNMIFETGKCIDKMKNSLFRLKFAKNWDLGTN